MTRNQTLHNLAYLTSDRMVAWKCLSLQARRGRDRREFAPVAYASRSRNFFTGLVNEGELCCDSHSPDAVLWVFTCPVFRIEKGEDRTYPPTLVAKIVVERVVSGDVVRKWGSRGDRSLVVPSGDGEAFQNWRRAVSIDDERERAIFRITRDFARIAWKKMKKDEEKEKKEKKDGKARQRQKKKPAATQLNAWKSVRTAIAVPGQSHFLAHTDATACLAKALGRPDIVGQPLDKRRQTVGQQLMSPRKITAEDSCVIKELNNLAAAGRTNTIFLNYRWNEKAKTVADIGLGLLKRGRGIWLDRLQIPALQSRPAWRRRGRKRRKDPPSIQLGHILRNAIRRSSLFLALASADYEDPPKNNPAVRNWAQKERRFARCCRDLPGAPQLGLVDLGGAPESLKSEKGRQWPYRGDATGLAARIVRETR